jgi:hypothetical protein
MAALLAYRDSERVTMEGDWTPPADPYEVEWVKSAWVMPQIMMHDRYFYDVASGEYTVDKFVDDLEARYGGVDAILVWQGYPNMGIDQRNQWDFMRSMPGGLARLKVGHMSFLPLILNLILCFE